MTLHVFKLSIEQKHVVFFKEKLLKAGFSFLLSFLNLILYKNNKSFIRFIMCLLSNLKQNQICPDAD